MRTYKIKVEFFIREKNKTRVKQFIKDCILFDGEVFFHFRTEQPEIRNIEVVKPKLQAITIASLKGEREIDFVYAHRKAEEKPRIVKKIKSINEYKEWVNKNKDKFEIEDGKDWLNMKKTLE